MQHRHSTSGGYPLQQKRRTVNSARRPRRRRKYQIVWKRFIPVVFFMITAIVSLSLLLNYGISSIWRRQENARLSAEYSQAIIQNDREEVEESTPDVPMTVRAVEMPQMQSVYHSMDGTLSSRMQRLYEQNNDLVGWLYIEGVVDLPVVYRDNEYYLTHNFKKKRDKGGALFLDENHPMTEETQHLVIHGHNMYDSSMFGILSSYEHLSVVKNNAFATFNTLYAAEDYVVFAVVRVNPDITSDEYFSYIGRPYFDREEHFYRYMDEIISRSMFNIPIDVLPSDSVLTLATCVDDERLIVVLRRIRNGETKQLLQQLIDQSYKK